MFPCVAQELQTDKLCHSVDCMTAIIWEMSYFQDLVKDFLQTIFLVSTGKDLNV